MRFGSVARAVLATGLAVAWSGAGVAGASPSAPYTDPAAVGYIGLCNPSGQQITSGRVDATPFAWRAISSVAAAPPYNNSYRTAILLAYQPRQGLVAGEWSGEELTASSRYSNPAHPMVAATGGDESLEDFIQDYPLAWDGFIELRIYLGTQNAEVESLHYPVLNIQVSGNTWHAVGGGPVDCRSGVAESIESILLPKSATSPSRKARGTSRAGVTSAPSSSTTAATPRPAGRQGTPSSSGHAASGPKRAASASLASSSSSDHTPLVLVGVAVAVALAVGGFLFGRRQRPSTQPSSSASPRRSARKGSHS